MRKILPLFALSLFAVEGYSDSARYTALGSPIVVKDTYLVFRYPSKLLQFPSAVFGTVSSASPVYMGVALVNDSRTAGIFVGYRSAGTVSVGSWGTPVDGTYYTHYGDYAFALGKWGMYLGGRISVQKLSSYESDDNLNTWHDAKGMAVYLCPAITMTLGKSVELNVGAEVDYRSADITYFNGATNAVSVSGLSAEKIYGLVIFNPDGKFSSGFYLSAVRNSEDVFLNGFSSTNTNSEVKNFIWGGGGFRYKASSDLKFYGNVGFTFYEIYLSNTVKGWTFPTLSLSSELGLGKGFFVRGGAQTIFNLSILIDSSGENHSTFSSASYFVGAGYSRLPFVVNAVIQNNFIVNGPFVLSGTTYPNVYSLLSLNYVF